MMRITAMTVLTVLLGTFLSCDKDRSPKLVLFIVVDQMREDMFGRYGNVLTGGLKFLMEQGVYFSEARHAHARPSTGPGHLVLATGRYPGSTGIIHNDWWDRDLNGMVYSVQDSLTKPLGGNSRGVSPRRVNATMVGDWMKKADRRSKVFAVSVKDRVAVLTAGKHPDGAFWYDPGTGDFVTTDYYMDRYPGWLDEFNGERIPNRYFGQSWNRLYEDETIYLERSREDDFPPERQDGYPSGSTFPHLLPEGNDYSLLPFWPWMNDITLDLARALIENERMGDDGHPDFLSVCFSATDKIGHRYGPYSQEVMDTFLRLDQSLASFFEFVDGKVGLENTLIVFSADHGAAMMPEFARRLNLDAGRYGGRWQLLVEEMEESLEGIWGQGSYIEKITKGTIWYDWDKLESKGLRPSEVDSILIPILENEWWVEKVYTRAQMTSGEPLDFFGQLWKNQFHPKHSGDLFFVAKENHIRWDPYGSTHDSPYDYDTHVPVIFAGFHLAPGVRSNRIETADVAPTIARILAIAVPGDLDGKALDF